MDKIIGNEKYEIYRLSIELASTSHFTNCYVVKDLITGYMMVIDPSYNAEYIKECLEKIGGILDKIYLTHCHGDHISALEELFNMYDKKVNILIHENDKDGIFDDMKNCKYMNLENENKEFVENVINGKCKMVCINDSDETIEFDKVKNEMIQMFEKILPEKSNFEK